MDNRVKFLSEEQFIGRENELKILQEMLNYAIDGRGGTVVISGEPGIGKSRLIAEFMEVARSKNIQVLCGYCIKSSQPYHVFTKVFKSVSFYAQERTTAIETVLLIHRATGLLVTAKTAAPGQMIDEDVLSGMLTAVQSFVRDAFRRADSNRIDTDTPLPTNGRALGKLEFGDTTLIIEHGSFLYIVGIVKAGEHPDMRKDLSLVLKRVEEKFGSVLAQWDGVTEGVRPIDELISTLLTKKYMLRTRAEDIDIERERARIFYETKAHLGSLASTKPVLLVVEDCHFADHSSLLLLQYLVEHMGKSRLLICLSYRHDEFTGESEPIIRAIERNAVRIELTAMSKGETGQIISALCGHMDDELIAAIFAHSHGNPFLVKELIYNLFEEGRIYQVDNTYKTYGPLPQLPTTTKSVLAQRIARLNEKELRMLEYSAVVGLQFSAAIVSKCLELETGNVQELLSKFVAARFITHIGGELYQFEHGIIRDVIYEEMSARWKVLSHKRVGIVIEETNLSDLDSVVYQLAEHFGMTNDYERGIEYNLWAGDKAFNNYAPAEALRFYHNALRILEQFIPMDTTKCVEIQEKLGDVHMLLGHYQDAAAIYMSAQQATNDIETIGRLYRKLGVLCERKGDFEQAEKYLRDGLDHVHGEKSPETARLCLALASLCTRNRRYQDAMRYCNKALSTLDISGDERDLAQLYHMFGVVHFYSQEFENALKYTAQSLAINRKLDLRPNIVAELNNLALIYKAKGNYDTAKNLYHEALQHAKKINDLRATAAILNNIASVMLSTEDYNFAIDHAEKSLKLNEQLGDLVGMLAAYENLIAVYSKKGDRSKVLDYTTKRYDVCMKLHHLDSIIRREIFL